MPVPFGGGSAPASPGLSYDPVLSRVRVSTQIPSSAVYATVERSTDQVKWSTVRGGTGITPTAGGWVTLSDYEFSPNVTNYYRVRAFLGNDFEIGPAKNTNPYMETDVSGWVGNGGAVTHTTVTPIEGAGSLLLTPDGVTATVQARATNVPTTPGNFYVASDRLLSTVARTAGISIIWRDAGAAILSQTLSSTVALAAGVPTYFEVTGQAPVGAVQATFVAVSMGGTPPAGHTMRVDEAYFVVIGGSPVFAGSITPDLAGAVWLKSLARPFLNRAVVVRDYSDVARRSRTGVFDVKGRTLPVAVTDVRSSRQWTLDVNTYNEQERSDLDLLLASGDILLVHVPPNSGRISAVPGGYVTVGDTKEVTLPTAELTSRVFSLPLTEVAAPGPDVVGATSTWQSVVNAYASWADVMAAHSTWADLLELIGDPTEVIVD